MKENLQDIGKRLSEYRTATWSELPDLDLYMDQVVTYVQKHLELFQSAQSEKLATPAILSNNVKAGLIPRPHKKKYGKSHIAALLMVCAFKQVFPASQVEQMLNFCQTQDHEKAFEEFGRVQDEMLAEVAKCMPERDLDDGDLHEMILRLALRANANRLAARMLLQRMEAKGEGKAKK